MPADYSLESSLFRVKRKVNGSWEDDPDVADPTVPLPEGMLSTDPEVRLAWKMPYRSGSKVKVKVTFRKNDGGEVAGSYTSYAFTVMPIHKAEAAMGATRPAIEKNPPAVNGTSPEPQVIDELGMNDTFGMRYSNISAGAATTMFVFVEEVG